MPGEPEATASFAGQDGAEFGVRRGVGAPVRQARSQPLAAVRSDSEFLCHWQRQAGRLRRARSNLHEPRPTSKIPDVRRAAIW